MIIFKGKITLWGEHMRDFNYSLISKKTWDSEVLGYIAAIYKEAGKQEMYLKQRPKELERLVEIAKIQSTEASNAIEGIVTTNTRIKQLVKEKTTPKNRAEEEIAGYRDVLNIIHESFAEKYLLISGGSFVILLALGIYFSILLFKKRKKKKLLTSPLE